MNRIPIKTLGIWKNRDWFEHNLQKTFEQIGKIKCIHIPADRIQNHQPFIDKVLQEVQENKPDLVFSYVNSRHAISTLFLKLKELGILCINMYLDDINKFKLIKPLASSFLLNITCTKHALPSYEKYKAHALYLPEGANPDSYKYECEKDIDISFVGGRYGNRSEAIQALKENYQVVARGKRWPHGKVSFKEMVELYSRAKIVIGFARSSSNSSLKSIKGRDFEATMCGAFYLCENNPELCDWFEPYKEIVFWDNIPDLLEKAKYYLENDREREEIASACSLRAHSEHTCMHRIIHLFKYLEDTFKV